MRGRRGKRRFCLVPSGFESNPKSRCGNLGPHVHVSHGAVFGNVSPGEIPIPLATDFLGRGGLLERGIAEWLIVGVILRLRRDCLQTWAWLSLDRLVRRADQEGWAGTWLAWSRGGGLNPAWPAHRGVQS